MPSQGVPETCVSCPHLDEFHGNCSHPLHQSIMWGLDDATTDCPVFAEIRAKEMRNLEQKIIE